MDHISPLLTTVQDVLASSLMLSQECVERCADTTGAYTVLAVPVEARAWTTPALAVLLLVGTAYALWRVTIFAVALLRSCLAGFLNELTGPEPVVRSSISFDVSSPPRPLRRVASPALTDPSRPGFIQCYDPATLTFLGEVAITSPEEVGRLIARARLLQRTWARTSFSARARVLTRIRDSILAQSEDIVRISCMDTGKPRVDALFGEIAASLGKLDYVINSGAAVLAPSSRASSLTTAHKHSRVTYDPFGVIGVIAPWNYPFYNLYNHIASALFAGNAVVLKMSEYSAWSATFYVRIARDVLAACGHDPDLVQLVQGFGETGAALVAGADKIIFTGSPGIGKAVMKGASATLTPLVLELGGKDPFIVCEDAPLDTVVAYATRGSFQNSGQNCVGIERIYVYDSLYDTFVAAAQKVVLSMRVGAPVDLNTGAFNQVDMGPITTAPQLGLIQALVDDAVAKGARLLVGGRSRFAGGGKAGDAADAMTRGLFYEPTLLVDVTHDMRIANEEVFGPVMTVLRVPHDSDDAAVAMANSTSYGLGATVFSASPTRANGIAARLRCGMVGINAYGLNYLNQDLPFGGVGASGFERFSGPEGLRACCLVKAVVADMTPWFSIPTPVPAPLQYPVSTTGPATADGLIHMQYAATARGRLAGLIGLLSSGARNVGVPPFNVGRPTAHREAAAGTSKVVENEQNGSNGVEAAANEEAEAAVEKRTRTPRRRRPSERA